MKAITFFAAICPVLALAGTAAPVIVLPDRPTAVERSAAEELADGIRRMTGGAPDMVSESAASNGGDAFFVGATRAAAALKREFGYDGILVKSVPGGVVLAGHPVRGAIYAVDEYLERFCGVRWWTSKESHYPRLSRLPMKGLNVDYAPQFKYRETYYLDAFNAAFKVRTKGNFSSLTRYMLDPMEFIPKEKGGNHRFHYFPGRRSAYHSFFEILPPSEHFQKHPEWYSEIKGERRPSQLCLMNLEMTAAFVEATRRILRSDTESDFISISQNDCTPYDDASPCGCADCAAAIAEDGSPSGAILRFVNRVAEALEGEFPNVMFDTFAYTWSRAAPKKTRPRRNVTVRYCNIECPFSFPLETPGFPTSEAYVANLKAWSAIASGRLYIWDYTAGFRNYMIPHPNLRSIAPNIRLFAKAGAVGVFEQGDALCCAGDFVALKHYLISHLLWNPGLDENELIGEFVEGYYGKAAAPKVMEHLSAVNDPPCIGRVPVRCYHHNVTNFMFEATAFAAERALADAEKAAAADGEVYVARVRREKLSIDQVFLLNWDEYLAWAKRNGVAWPFGDDRRVAAERWIAAVNALGVKAVHETVTRGPFSGFCRKLLDGNPPR